MKRVKSNAYPIVSHKKGMQRRYTNTDCSRWVFGLYTRWRGAGTVQGSAPNPGFHLTTASVALLAAGGSLAQPKVNR